MHVYECAYRRQNLSNIAVLEVSVCYIPNEVFQKQEALFTT